MEALVKYRACNYCVIGEKTFKTILIGPGKLPGLSRNGPLASFKNVIQLGLYHYITDDDSLNCRNMFLFSEKKKKRNILFYL